MNDYQNYSLLKHNTFAIAARCRRFVEYASETEAQALSQQLKDTDRPLLIIGSGSNLLLTTDYYDGTVIHSVIKGMEMYETVDGTGDVLLRCGSGEVWDEVVEYMVEQGWQGAENLSLIPGEVGASAIQNIGAYGAEVKDLIESVEAVRLSDGNKCVFTNDDCEYSYRQSKFKHAWKNLYLITAVTYRLHRKSDYQPKLDYGNIRSKLDELHISTPTLSQLRQIIMMIREEKLPDPKVQGNAGSFFMNPIVSKEKYEQLAALYDHMPHYTIDAAHEKIPAGWMIDQCGWKGKSLGPAGVHDKQALVLVNKGNATGKDVVVLYQTIQKDVKNKFGIDIMPEVNVIG